MSGWQNWPRLAVAIWAVGLAPTAWADAVADALAPHVGTTLDVVELGTGRRVVRPTLERVVERNGKTESVRIVEEGQSRPTSLLLKGITKIVADRATVYQAEAAGGGAAGLRGRVVRARREAELAATHERMQARGVEPWPALSSDEHAAEVERLKALVDSMHDLLCDLDGIPRGEPVWTGKCLVVAFRDEGEFHAFEARFMRADIPRGVHGLCHQSSDGRVIMACHRGADADAFAHMLVHETSHGFNHRWLSPERIPNWLNEGLAEWVGTQVVPRSRQVPAKEAQARAFMQQTGSLGPEFLTAANIEPIQYGISSQLVKFLVARDRKKFAQFVRGIKEGMTAEESLEAAFKGSLTNLIAAFGSTLGVPNLQP